MWWGTMMDFRLSGVGNNLEIPCTSLIQGDLSDAMRAAIAMLDQHPSCDEIEIFAGSRFVREVHRSMLRLVA
jgi:hypothetical protein